MTPFLPFQEIRMLKEEVAVFPVSDSKKTTAASKQHKTFL